jgi:hypothetical protein
VLPSAGDECSAPVRNKGEIMKQRALGILVSGMMFLALGAKAQNIAYTFDGTGSGNVDGNAFADAAFTITLYADTGSIVSCGGDVVSVDSLSADIAISGFDDLLFSDPTRIFDNNLGVAGFSGGGCNGSDYLDLSDPAFQTYDLSTSIGPIFVASPFAVGQFHDVRTSGGILTMDSARDVTFNAVTFSPSYTPARGTSAFPAVYPSGHGIVSGIGN